MTVAGSIRRLLEAECGALRARDVRIGLGYTAVQLEDDRTGVAYTFRESMARGCSVFQGQRPLACKSAADLLSYLEATDPIEAAVGLATANALANRPPSDAVTGDVLDAIELHPSDHVCMVGFFGPLISPLKKRVQTLDIFDEGASKDANVRPPQDALTALPSCDVALITSTAIINGTIDPLLDAASACRRVVLLGSSTPQVPQAFDGSPVTWLSGITVHDTEGILRVISEGGGTRFFKPHVAKWNVRLGT